MRKNIFGRHLQRDSNERKALFKGLISGLVLHERIETTEAKAKAIKGLVEKLVTRTLRGRIPSQDFLQQYLNSDAVKKMIADVAPRFVNRPGGYTRIIRLQRRFADNAPMVFIEWVEKKVVDAKSSVKALDAKIEDTQKEVKKTKVSKKESKIVQEKPKKKRKVDGK